MDSFIEILTHKPDDPTKGITFIENGIPSHLSYENLSKEIPYTAGKLALAGVKPLQYVVFQLTNNRDIIYAFWGCVWIGAVPVIVPPALSENDETRIKKAIEMVPDCIVLADDLTFDHLPDCNAKKFVEILDLKCDPIEHPFVAESDTMRLIQMSSGSTGDPKGIIVEEETIMNAMDATIPRRPHRYQNSMLTWLPLTHNMSLLGIHIYSMFRDFPQVLIPTADFIKNPICWFEAITEYQPTITVCPNFAFSHIMRCMKARSIDKNSGFDLSNIQKLISASEPIDITTALNFAGKLSQLGLQENALIAAYGMSEACLQITTSEIYTPLKTVCLDRSAIQVGATLQDIESPDCAYFVSVGKAVPNMEISIRDNEGNELEGSTLGEIYIRGTSLTHASLTRNGIVKHKLTDDGYLATGDIGMLVDDDLYVVARKKDIIFIGGKNYYSPDLEGLLMSDLELDSIVLGRTNHDVGEEEVVVFITQETEESFDSKIRETLATKAGVPVNQIVRIEKIPRASNGKKMRRELESLL